MATKYLVVIGLVSLFLGPITFWNGDSATITSLTNGLIAVAAIIFGILGAWMSMLNPVKALDEAEVGEESSRRYKLALQLSPVLKQATLALAAVVLIRLLLLILPEVGSALEWTVERLARLGWPEWRFPKALAAIAGALSRTFLGASVIFLYLFEIVILVLTLLPILSVEGKHQEDQQKKELRTDPASQYDKVEN